MRRRPDRPRLLAAAIVMLLATAPATGCTEVESAAVEGYEPAHVQPAKRGFPHVTFTAEGARRTALETALVRRVGARTAVPSAALIYDAAGRTYVYTTPEPLTFVRARVTVADVAGTRALLADGPPPGTAVVTTGAAEVYGAELEIAGGH
jgi:hypothetical protein